MAFKKPDGLNDDEIDLTPYFKTILKHKKKLIGIIIFFAIGAVFLQFLSPKLYEMSVIIEPAVVKVESTGSKIYCQPDGGIKTYVENEVFLSKISKKTGIPVTEIPVINVAAVAPGSKLLKIKLLALLNKKDIAFNILRESVNEIREGCEGIVEIRQKKIADKIELLKKKIIETELIELSKNKKFRNQHDKVFFGVIVKGRNHGQYEDGGWNAENKEIALEKLNFHLAQIKNVVEINAPAVSSRYVSPKFGKTLILSIIVGFFAGIIVVFVYDFFQRERK